MSWYNKLFFTIVFIKKTIIYLFIAINAFSILPRGKSSFEFNDDEIKINNKNIFGMVSYILLAFAHGIGIPIPWMLISEMFPYRYKMH